MNDPLRLPPDVLCRLRARVPVWPAALVAGALALPVPPAAAAPAPPRPAARKPAPAPAPARSTARKPAPAPAAPGLPVAGTEQRAAAAMAHRGEYTCDFDQRVSVEDTPRQEGYLDVRMGKSVWTMRPVLSSTGALRLEDVRGATLMLQIANKSMLMDVRAGRRLVDDCVHAAQLQANRDAKAAGDASGPILGPSTVSGATTGTTGTSGGTPGNPPLGTPPIGVPSVLSAPVVAPAQPPSAMPATAAPASAAGAPAQTTDPSAPAASGLPAVPGAGGMPAAPEAASVPSR